MNKKPGCFISMVIVAAMLLAAGWLFGEFVLAPVHCHSAVCARWTRQLHISVISSFAGLGCLLLAGLNIRPGVFLALGVGMLGITALAGYANPGMFVLIGVNILVVAAVGGWFAVGWLDA